MPDNETVAFVLSSLFLLGIILAIASVVPSLKARYPKLFMTGFALSVLSILTMAVYAVVGA